MSAPRSTGSAGRTALWAFIAMPILACSLPPSTTAPRLARYDGSLKGSLTAAEISSSGAIKTYDAVALLRPRFLKIPGAMPRSEPGVYLDGLLLGGIAELANIPVQLVREVRSLSPLEATARFGATRFVGAVLVTTRTAQDH
jgi:hypothetical protein